MTRKFLNKTIALAFAAALFLLATAAYAGPNSSRCYQYYDWATGVWKVVCLPWW